MYCRAACGGRCTSPGLGSRIPLRSRLAEPPHGLPGVFGNTFAITVQDTQIVLSWGVSLLSGLTE